MSLQIIACPDCDLLYQAPSPTSHGLACCLRCGATVFHRKHNSIERTLALMEPQFKNNIQVVRDFGDLPRVRCYPGQLNQVFLNLLMNACDAIGKDGEIRVKTRPTDGGVRLEFHDDGSGIPADVQSQIFDPFFTTKPVGEGTGLGLSLSHGIIERHGGRIFVGSEVGRGTTFVIDLPRIADDDEG
ncbi:MAG: hypothetical protein IH827_10770 [Myxococcales bacterium]|nr:hypothetical protein [Myxococcales bacterium]